MKKWFYLHERALESAWLAYDNACSGEPWRKKDRMRAALLAYFENVKTTATSLLVDRLINGPLTVNKKDGAIQELEEAASVITTLHANVLTVEQENAYLRKVILDTQSIVSDAIANGFIPFEGDWVNRLVLNQRVLNDVKKLDERHQQVRGGVNDH